MEASGGDPSPGTKCILSGGKTNMNDYQLWYEDTKDILRSKLNGYALTAGGKT